MKNILGYRNFLTKQEVRKIIRSSVNYENEDTNSAKLLCFFKTSMQRTWLVATQKRVYIILDDIRNIIPADIFPSLLSVFHRQK